MHFRISPFASRWAKPGQTICEAWTRTKTDIVFVTALYRAEQNFLHFDNEGRRSAGHKGEWGAKEWLNIVQVIFGIKIYFLSVPTFRESTKSRREFIIIINRILLKDRCSKCRCCFEGEWTPTNWNNDWMHRKWPRYKKTKRAFAVPLTQQLNSYW